MAGKKGLFIKVPIYRQKQGAVDCGIVCMQMVYAYYGKPLSFDELKSELPTTKIGTYAPQIGAHFQEHGLTTEIITLNPKLFHGQILEEPLLEMRSYFQKLRAQADNENDKMILGHFVDFLGKGGKVVPSIPTAEHIRRALTEGHLIMAVLNTTSLYTNNKDVSWKDAFHIVLITGIDDRLVYLNDPNWNKNGGRTSYPMGNFFFSLYSSSLADPDNGSLLVVKD